MSAPVRPRDARRSLSIAIDGAGTAKLRRPAADFGSSATIRPRRPRVRCSDTVTIDRRKSRRQVRPVGQAEQRQAFPGVNSRPVRRPSDATT